MSSAQRERPVILRFEDFEVNPYTRQILRAGRPVAIQPKPFDLLLYLIRHRDRLVPRDEILAEVWKGVRVDAQALGFALHAVRKALGDDGNRQTVIRTVSRSGLQFVAPLETVVASEDALVGGGWGTGARAFLGRDRLIAEARRILGEVEQGASRVLFLSGEPGIGKTRALEQIGELAEAQGFRVFRASCIESEGAPAFWPWIQILRAAVDSDPPSGLLAALGEGAREVAWMVPELRPYVRELPHTPTLDPRAARFLLFDSVSAFLDALAADIPHLVCIDDLHRADAASAALLLHAVRELARAGAPRLALVGTYRDAELRAQPELADVLLAATTLPHARHEALLGLEPADVGTLVERVSGRTPSAVAVSELHRKTNGNPFFLEQILRVLTSEKRLAELESARGIDLVLPPHVQDSIRHQLRALPDAVRAIVELAAVAGREFRVADLEIAAEESRSHLLAWLSDARDGGIVAEHGDEVGGYRFVHVLVRDAIYSGLSLEGRARLHGRIARALAERTSGAAGPESAALAHHHAQSSTPGDAERAVGYYRQAAAWSRERGAFDDAPQFLDKALSLLSATANPSEKVRCQVLLELGDALTDAGERNKARATLQNAAALAHRAELHEELAIAALRFAPDLLAIETGVYDTDLVRILVEAIDCIRLSLPSLRAKLLARLAIANQWNNADVSCAKTSCEQAIVVAAQANDQDAREYVETSAALIDFSVFHPERLLVEVSVRNASLAILQRILRVTSLMMLGRVADADAEIRVFSELVERSRHPQARWYVDLMRATRAQMKGDHQEAAQRAKRYLELGSKYGDRNAIHSYMTQVVMASIDTGAVSIEESHVRSMIAAFPSMVGWRAGLALFLTEFGRLEEARRELHLAVDSGALEKPRPNEWYGSVAGVALSCGALRERRIAEVLYEILHPLSGQLTVVGYSSYCLGSTHRLLGVLASVLENWEAADHHFHAAISVNKAIGARACNGASTSREHERLTGLGEEGRH